MTEHTAERIFTISDFVKDGAERTAVHTYRDDDVTTIVEWVEPGKEFQPPHLHPESAHVFVFVSGEGEALVGNGRWEPVRAGQFLVNPRNKVHALRNTSGSERLVWACIHVSHGQYVVQETGEDHE